MHWTDAYLTIICQLLAEQVRKGNRPNTHLNTLGYTEVSDRFFQMTGIELTKTQIKNRWDKLKIDWTIWQKLMRLQTGTGWDSAKGIIVMDNEWWRKTKKDIPGCGKFKKKPLQCEEQLREMFGNISSDETDHWNPMSSNPVVPENNVEPFTVDGINDVPNEEDHEDIIHDWAYQEEEEEDVQEVTPTSENAKKRPRVVLEIPKKAKSSIALIIQEKISTIAESAASFTSRKEAEVSIKEVMQHVLECGADYGSNEHDIATQLFVKKDQREMFLTLPTNKIRFDWLTRRYNDKYGSV
ncbi:hypothetical protein GQ55_8G162800 [Panicum hallii var. hallii]|uniref:Myb/SANT-like domain-containing protein n=1 Tax=Panicum hallii var. hallii TaxID=1504633 RepID=A0A2T7CNE6_9POAL|nr:hypothetical protein GQ55_8G162800 [Panicum hallii var. hallii]